MNIFQYGTVHEAANKFLYLYRICYYQFSSPLPQKETDNNISEIGTETYSLIYALLLFREDKCIQLISLFIATIVIQAKQY